MRIGDGGRHVLALALVPGLIAGLAGAVTAQVKPAQVEPAQVLPAPVQSAPVAAEPTAPQAATAVPGLIEKVAPSLRPATEPAAYAEPSAPASAPSLPAGAAAYASADPAADPFPKSVAPGISASPAAPVPAVPDPSRPVAALPEGVDAAALRQVIDLYRRGNVAEADRLRAAIPDESARALLEWTAIRFGLPLGFERIVGFARANPDWPTSTLMRRRAEEALLNEKKPATVVRAFFAKERPSSPPGKLALALAFQRDGLARDAAAVVRELWREDTFGREFEARVMDAFPGVLTEVDHRYRMERLLCRESFEAAGRAATYAGKAYGTLVRARRAVEDKSAGAAAALDAVPPSLRADSSYLLSKAQWLRRADKPLEAAKVMALAPRNPEVIASADEWWIERRIVARKLLDAGDARSAYMVASGHSATTPEKRIEGEFHAGWIALRFLDDARLAAGHFAEAARVAETPISLARTAYWQGRAAEALGRGEDAKAFYLQAADQSVAYYGQLARAKLGRADLPLRPPAVIDAAERSRIEARIPFRAARIANALGLKEISLPLYVELGAKLAAAPELDALGDLALEGRDPRALVAVGKAALQRGFALDLHAYPTIGIPAFEASAAVLPVERAMVFAIARQESQFDPKAQSGVGARGLMQLMPATAARTAKRIGVAYDTDRLTEEPAYNAKIGTAHLGELMADWKGSYVLAFASYNAGGGNVKKWIDAYGDPRNPGVDPIDWVERIPFTETRNYVQRVMENVQVYRHRLDGRSALLIDSDLRRGAR
jgi:soluble lytic murein transglycosylase